MRQALAEDGEFLAQVFLASMREVITLARGSWDEQRECAQFQRQLQLRHTEIFELAGVAVGFVTLVPGESEIELHTVCVAPAYQGRGFGSFVLQTVAHSARAQGKAVVLSVLKSNPRALALYERLGYSVVGQSEHHFHLRLHHAG